MRNYFLFYFQFIFLIGFGQEFSIFHEKGRVAEIINVHVQDNQTQVLFQSGELDSLVYGSTHNPDSTAVFVANFDSTELSFIQKLSFLETPKQLRRVRTAKTQNGFVVSANLVTPADSIFWDWKVVLFFCDTNWNLIWSDTLDKYQSHGANGLYVEDEVAYLFLQHGKTQVLKYDLLSKSIILIDSLRTNGDNRIFYCDKIENTNSILVQSPHRGEYMVDLSTLKNRPIDTSWYVPPLPPTLRGAATFINNDGTQKTITKFMISHHQDSRQKQLVKYVDLETETLLGWDTLVFPVNELLALKPNYFKVGENEFDVVGSIRDETPFAWDQINEDAELWFWKVKDGEVVKSKKVWTMPYLETKFLSPTDFGYVITGFVSESYLDSVPIPKQPFVFLLNHEGEILSVQPLNTTQGELSVFPNPAQNQLFLSKPLHHIQVVDVQGKLVQSSSEILTNKIDVEALPTGVYVLTGQTEEGKTVNTRFLKL